jgi:hypothetical protein
MAQVIEIGQTVTLTLAPGDPAGTQWFAVPDLGGMSLEKAEDNRSCRVTPKGQPGNTTIKVVDANRQAIRYFPVTVKAAQKDAPTPEPNQAEPAASS